MKSEQQKKARHERGLAVLAAMRNSFSRGTWEYRDRDMENVGRMAEFLGMLDAAWPFMNQIHDRGEDAPSREPDALAAKAEQEKAEPAGRAKIEKRIAGLKRICVEYRRAGGSHLSDLRELDAMIAGLQFAMEAMGWAPGEREDF